MRRLSAIAAVLLGAGCIYIDTESEYVEDEHSKAANSWLGANIQEMTAIWPPPNMHCGSNTIGEAGCAWWRHRYESGAVKAAYGYRCEVIARYNEDGVITRIEVKQSYRCDSYYGDNFERLTRQTGGRARPRIEDMHENRFCVASRS